MLPAGARIWILGAAVLLLAAWGAHWVYQRATHVYLDDARIDGEVVAISSRVAGWITELTVIEGEARLELFQKCPLGCHHFTDIEGVLIDVLNGETQ